MPRPTETGPDQTGPDQIRAEPEHTVHTLAEGRSHRIRASRSSRATEQKPQKKARESRRKGKRKAKEKKRQEKDEKGQSDGPNLPLPVGFLAVEPEEALCRCPSLALIGRGAVTIPSLSCLLCFSVAYEGVGEVSGGEYSRFLSPFSSPSSLPRTGQTYRYWPPHHAAYSHPRV
jgi:hypothetical protein